MLDVACSVFNAIPAAPSREVQIAALHGIGHQRGEPKVSPFKAMI
jgi:hypothetical protein